MKKLVALGLCVGLAGAGCGGNERDQPADRTLNAPWADGENGTSRDQQAARPADQPADAAADAQSTTPPATRPADQSAADQAQQQQQQQDEVPERLYGTWVAQNVDAPVGQVDVEVTFREEGPVKILAWSDLPLVGQVRSKSGPFRVEGNRIISEAIRGGTSVRYFFTPEGHLVIQYEEGERVVFRKK